MQGHSSAEIVTPARPDPAKRVSFRDDSPPSRSTEDSAMIPGPKPQWVNDSSRRKKLRLSAKSPPQSGAPPAGADSGMSRHENGVIDDSGPAVPRSHFSAPGEQTDWALHDLEAGPAVPRSSFA